MQTPTPNTFLDHERLDVWRVGIELDRLVVGIGRGAVRGHGWFVDQALRASGSALLNLAEAMGRRGADRARCLGIARGSAMELGASLELLRNRGVGPEATHAQARALTLRVVAMLTRLQAVASR